MILNSFTKRLVRYFFEIYLPVRENSWLIGSSVDLVPALWVDPSWISNLERKRGKYEDYGFVRAKRQLNVASKRRFLRSVWKEPYRGWVFVTIVTFLRISEILDFAKKSKKNTYGVTKT